MPVQIQTSPHQTRMPWCSGTKILSLLLAQPSCPLYAVRPVRLCRPNPATNKIDQKHQPNREAASDQDIHQIKFHRCHTPPPLNPVEQSNSNSHHHALPSYYDPHSPGRLSRSLLKRPTHQFVHDWHHATQRLAIHFREELLHSLKLLAVLHDG